MRGKGRRRNGGSEIVTEPSSQSAPEAARRLLVHGAAQDEVALVAHRVGEQPGGGREGRPAGGLGQAVNGQRPAHADLLVENELRQLADALELASAAGQDHATAGDLVEAARLQARADELENLLHSRLDEIGRASCRERVVQYV